LRHILVRREEAALEDGRAGEVVTGLSRPVLQLILASGGVWIGRQSGYRGVDLELTWAAVVGSIRGRARGAQRGETGIERGEEKGRERNGETRERGELGEREMERPR
jgi:hypothetical protein